MLPRSIFKKCPGCGLVEFWDEKGEWYVGISQMLTPEQEVAYALAGILQTRLCLLCWQMKEAREFYSQLGHPRVNVTSG